MSRLLVLCALLAVVAVVGASPSPDSAADYYLKIGDIKGEAADGSIAVTGIAWDTHAEVGRFAVEPPAEVLARYGGAQFASAGMAAGLAVSDPGAGGSKPAARQGQVQTPREAGSGMATGRRTHSPVTFVKQWDKASPKLMEACANGSHQDVEVWERNEAGQDYLRYTLKDAIITSYSVTRGGDADDRPTESISFNFEKIEMASATPQPAGASNLNSSKSN